MTGTTHDPLRTLIADWRERARLARPFESAPLTAEKRKRVAEWIMYTNRASELESVLQAQTPKSDQANSEGSASVDASVLVEPPWCGWCGGTCECEAE